MYINTCTNLQVYINSLLVTINLLETSESYKIPSADSPDCMFATVLKTCISCVHDMYVGQYIKYCMSIGQDYMSTIYVWTRYDYSEYMVLLQVAKRLAEAIERETYMTHGRLVGQAYRRNIRHLVFALKNQESIRNDVVSGDTLVSDFVKSYNKQLVKS